MSVMRIDPIAAVRHLNDRGHFVFVVTNQAGVAKGLYAESDIHAFHACMQRELARAGAYVDAFYYCPFHEHAIVPRYRVADHADRKPRPGMIIRALREWPVAPSGSFLIGDQDSDIHAADAAGIAGFRYRGGDLHELVRRLTSPARTRAPAALALPWGHP
jgi:D-glycero-D-manno-heptose 1,7-bisphosphate phosphatase